MGNGMKDKRELEDRIIGQMPGRDDLWNEWTLRQAIRSVFYFMENGEYPIEPVGPEPQKAGS
jgi:hypothetical protein